MNVIITRRLECSCGREPSATAVEYLSTFLSPTTFYIILQFKKTTLIICFLKFNLRL